MVTWRAAAVIAVLALTGCSSTGGTVATDAPAGTNRPAATSLPPEETEAAPPEETTEAPPPAPANPVFGDTFTYDDGLAVTISAPATFEPSEFAAAPEGAAAYVSFDVTIVNGTAANFDPTIFSTTLQSGNTEAQEVFDGETFNGSPSTTILPGREVTFKIGYGVADPADLVLEVSPDFLDHDSVIFTS